VWPAVTARILAVLLICVALPAFAENDPRVPFLEQEIRDLQRQVLTLNRRIDELSTRPARLPAQTTDERTLQSPSELPLWVDASKWQRLRVGMSELEVINALGAPTSMREEGDARVLLYAMEIGSSGFLGGSVKLRDRAVVELKQPTLQ
jgi:prefoldin subunit 5